jgi:hypothetical protein
MKVTIKELRSIVKDLAEMPWDKARAVDKKKPLGKHTLKTKKDLQETLGAFPSYEEDEYVVEVDYQDPQLGLRVFNVTVQAFDVVSRDWKILDVVELSEEGQEIPFTVEEFESLKMSDPTIEQQLRKSVVRQLHSANFEVDDRGFEVTRRRL